MNSRTLNVCRRFACLALFATAGLVLAACGSDDKPAFCADRDSFRESVDQIPSLAADGNLSGLRDQISTVERDADTLVESAKADYPRETDAIETSVNSLRTSVDNLPQDPSAGQIAAVGLEAATAVSAVKNCVDATDADCG